MPRIPVDQNNGGAPAPGPSGGLQAPDYGPGIGPGLQALGQGVGQVAEVAHEQQTYLNDAALKQLDNSGVQNSDAVLHTGDNAYLHTSGQDALNGRDGAIKAITDFNAGLIEQAKNPYQRRRITELVQARQESDFRQIGDHYDAEHKTYDLKQTTARIGIQSDTAAVNYADPDKSEAAIATLSSEYDNMARLDGWSPEMLQYQRTKGISGVRKDIVTRMAASGESGPATAQAYLDRFSGSFTSDDAASAQSGIRTYQNHYDAQARAAAADARRQQREDESDARQQVTDGLAILNTGTPLPPEKMASLHDAAVRAGPHADALRFQLGQAEFKNNLNVEYNNATPSEIDARVDELGAKIAKAGNSPDMQDVVEFNHLKGMQASAQAQLRTDPLSWGAQHLGIQVQPINYGDPNSITARINAAHTIAARAGIVPQYLQPDEAAKEAPVWQNGTAEEKVGLVSRLAKFGPAGTAAAQQVDKDPMLAHLVGLATLPDRAVSAAIVNATMAGPEAIKAHKGLVDGPGATQQMAQLYDQTIGGALRLMPQADAGTRSTATNYFAGKMASQGVYQWSAGSHAYPNAISSALGGYNDHGVMRGGIGTSNGAKTVLPTGTTQQEFDTRIARATTASLSNASNGLPVWSDGKTPLKGSDVKRAQYVPVGDGRYALFANGGFVQKQGGGRFEIDWRKVQ